MPKNVTHNLTAAQAAAQAAAAPHTSTAVLGKMKQKLIDGGAQKEDTVVVARSELESLKRLIVANRTEQEQKVKHEREKEKTFSAAQSLKEKIVQIDNERIGKGAKVTALEDAEMEMKRMEEIKKSKKQLDEDLDEVKYMNKVIHYAKCVTIRDAQIQEKGLITQERKEEDKRLDMMMEMERLKAIKMYEEREAKRIEDRKKGAAVIRAQIEEREQERLRQLELKQQEQEAMLRHISKMKNDDRREAEHKREQSRRLMEDVALANAEQIRLKTKQRETEMEEERRITQYLREKEKRDQDIQEDGDRTRHEKEREIARLRTMQERQQDKQAELDALRAKRAQELYERDWRQKEKDEAQRIQRNNIDLARAREQQMREKEALLAEQAYIENDEFERIIALQRAEDEIEQEKREMERLKRMKHAQELKEQIAYTDEHKRKERREFVEEGIKLRKQREEDAAKLDFIRREKLRTLESTGVPEKYRNELLRVRRNFQEDIRPAK